MPLAENINAMEIGRKIKLLRIDKGQSLQEVSSCTGLSTLTLCQIENGNYHIFLGKFPQFIELASLYAKYFDCNINDYLESNFNLSAKVDIADDEPSIPYFLRKKNYAGK